LVRDSLIAICLIDNDRYQWLKRNPFMNFSKGKEMIQLRSKSKRVLQFLPL
jgi:hypothetical protein